MNVIIDEVKFYMNDLDGKDYFVHAYAQDPDESDQYTVEISEVLEDEDEEVCVLYVDSSGNMTDDIGDEPYITKALDVLFVKLEHGIIRGF